MYKNYIKIALRNIQKHKGYSFLNISGLAIGMACCILILLWVQDELSFDRFNKNVNDIYRVIEERHSSGGEVTHATWTPGPLVPAIDDEFPEISSALRVLFFNDRRFLSYGEKSFYESGVIHADASLFTMFNFPLIKGDESTIFSDPFSIVFTENMCRKYFGDENPIGKTIKISNFCLSWQVLLFLRAYLPAAIRRLFFRNFSRLTH